MNEEKLRELLENVSDSYYDFVEGILASCKKRNAVDKMISALLAHPDWETSDFIMFETEEILGIKPVSPIMRE